MIQNITEEQSIAIKKSFFNILAFFLEQENIESRYLRCMLKWGMQLNLSKEDLVISNMHISQLSFTEPRKKIESVFHLVYLIYLDNVVEDVELEVATIYSERLGFPSNIISELFTSIAEMAASQEMPHNIQAEIESFMKNHKY